MSTGVNTAADQPAVVAGIDGSEAALGAARWAAEFATRAALPLTLLHAVRKLDLHFLGPGATAELERLRTATACSPRQSKLCAPSILILRSAW